MTMKLPRVRDWQEGTVQVAVLVRNTRGYEVSFSSNPIALDRIDDAARIVAHILRNDPALARRRR